MAYEFTDPLINGLRLIARDTLTSSLASTFGSTSEFPAVRDTRGYPIPLDMIQQLKLPAMAIYIEKEDGAPMARWQDDQKLSVVFEYFMEATPMGKLDPRWGGLALVWRRLVDLVQAGTVPTVPTPTTLLALGAAWIFREHTVQYDFATDGDRAYPHFIGRIPIRYRPPTSSDYDDLVALFADINRTDGNPAIQPQVQVIATV